MPEPAGRRLREPVSGLTHFAGAMLAAVGLVALVAAAGGEGGSLATLVGGIIYGTSLVLMFSASALYHLLPVSPRGQLRLKRFDHMMIYVLIAGTYTPVCLGPLRGPLGATLLAVVWTLAALGLIQKAIWIHAPRWLSTALYLGLGWLAVLVIRPLMAATPPAFLGWIVAGGLCYTVGAVIYALRRPNPIPGWVGFHEIWHLFVLGGSFAHFWAIFRYLSL